MFTGIFFLNQIYLKHQVPEVLVVIDDCTSTIGGTYICNRSYDNARSLCDFESKV